MRLHAWLLVLALALCPSLARAQVETDGSLGAAGLVPSGMLPDGTLATYRIDESLGQRRGGNLFHSFSRFGVPAGQSAAFTADVPTERVLARVTGGAPSVIGGRLRSLIPGADLYLMNPSGVLFSQGSSLDVQGSLYLSSARSLGSTDGTRFESVATPGEVLTSAAPSAWGFTSEPSGAVTIRGCNCVLPRGETFSAVGALVDVRSTASSFSQIATPGGRIQLGATLSAGDVPLDLRELDARDAAAGALGEVRIVGLSELDVSDLAGETAGRGGITLRGGTISLVGPALSSQSPSAAQADPVDIDLEATESIVVGTSSDVAASALSSSAGGGIRLSARDISVVDGSVIETRSFDQGEAGSVDFEAERISFGSAARIGSTSQIDGGPGGAIRIRASAFEIVGGAQLTGTTLGSGRASDIDVDVAGDVVISGTAPTGPSGIFARSGLDPSTTATGDGGEISIAARRLTVDDGAELSVQSFGTGTVGTIRIAASEGVRVGSAGSTAASINSQTALATGGDIEIDTPELMVARGGLITATTNGEGDAGSIRVDANRIAVGGGEPEEILEGGIFAQSLADPGAAAGRGGDIELRGADQLEVLDGGVVSVSTRGSGDAGAVRIEAVERVSIRGGTISGLSSQVGRGGLVSMDIGELRMHGGTITTEARESGVGGEISIDAARNVSLDGGARIGATTLQTAQAGTVRLRVGQTLTLDGGSQITTQTSFPDNGGAAGDVSVRAREVVVRNDSAITSDSSGAGEAGTIAIDATRRVRLESGGRISSQTSLTGAGGSIDVRANTVQLATGGSISAASTGDGDAGSVRIVAGKISVGRDARITSETESGGAGGDVDLQARRAVDISSGGQVTARSGGANDAGNVRIDAGDELTVRDGGRITTQAEQAFGGNIDLSARHLLYVRDGEITTSVNTGEGNGGNITIDPKFVVLNNGRIEARANAGNGGNIIVRADHFLADVDSAVDASSELGIDGQVQISSPEANLTSELAQLETEYLDASARLSRACAARSGQGTFQVTGGAKKSAPDAPLEERAESAEGEPAPSCR